MEERVFHGYLGNGLFSLADRMLNALLAEDLRAIPGVALYVPQENGDINDKTQYADSVMIAKADNEQLDKADFMVAVIDGVEVDAGLAAEIGRFSTTRRPIFALYTDVRQQGADNPQKIAALQDVGECQFMYRNLYLIGLIKMSGGGVYQRVDDLTQAVRSWVSEKKAI